MHKLTDRFDLYLQYTYNYKECTRQRAWTKVSNPDTIGLEAVRLHVSFGSYYCPLVPFARTYDSTKTSHSL